MIPTMTHVKLLAVMNEAATKQVYGIGWKECCVFYRSVVRSE